MSDIMREVTIEAINEALEEVGELGKISDKAIENIASWVDGNYENQSLITGPVENPLKREIEELKDKHEKEISGLDRENDAFRESVRKRRGADSVWVDGDTVYYR